MKSLFADTRQQKYWDHGRSARLLNTTLPMCFARSSCVSGGDARNASIPPSASRVFGSGYIDPAFRKQFLGFGLDRPLNVFFRIDSYGGSDGRKEHMRDRVPARDAYRL